MIEMQVVWFLVYLAGSVMAGVWLGWRAASANRRINTTLAAHQRDWAVEDAADMAMDGEELAVKL